MNIVESEVQRVVYILALAAAIFQLENNRGPI
jgi:hypothetical protein